MVTRLGARPKLVNVGYKVVLTATQRVGIFLDCSGQDNKPYLKPATSAIPSVTMTVDLNPRIRVREAVPADAEAITNTMMDGFSVDAMHQLIYPNGVSDESRRKFASRIFTPIPPSEGEKLIMVAELLPEGSDGPGEIVAFSDWRLFRNPRTEEEWNIKEEPKTQEQLGEGCDVKVFNEFIGGLHRKRHEHMKGDPGLGKYSTNNIFPFSVAAFLTPRPVSSRDSCLSDKSPKAGGRKGPPTLGHHPG